MTLSDYLARHELTPAAFARRIDVNERESVRRYLNGTRTPSREVMRRIFAATNGEVTANDFFDLGDGPVTEDAQA